MIIGPVIYHYLGKMLLFTGGTPPSGPVAGLRQAPRWAPWREPRVISVRWPWQPGCSIRDPAGFTGFTGFPAKAAIALRLPGN